MNNNKFSSENPAVYPGVADLPDPFSSARTSRRHPRCRSF